MELNPRPFNGSNFLFCYCNIRGLKAKMNSQFQCRQAEHMNVSVRTGLPLTLPNHSAILQHSKSTGHEIFQRNFKILSKTYNKKDIISLESLYITKSKPNLNTGVPVDLDVFSF